MKTYLTSGRSRKCFFCKDIEYRMVGNVYECTIAHKQPFKPINCSILIKFFCEVVAHS